MEAVDEKRKERQQEDDMEWLRTRSIWVPIMNANFKKQGGGKFDGSDLITLPIDKPNIESAKPTLETFEHLVKRYGKRKKKNVN